MFKSIVLAILVIVLLSNIAEAHLVPIITKSKIVSSALYNGSDLAKFSVPANVSEPVHITNYFINLNNTNDHITHPHVKRGAQSSALPSTRPTTLKPVISSAFGDPCLFYHDGTFYSFATRPLYNMSMHIQAATSQDFKTWKLERDPITKVPLDVMPHLPEWVVPTETGDGATWAPSVTKLLPDEDSTSPSFLMYFTARTGNHSAQCIGAGRASQVLGPYTPLSELLFCPAETGGAIDPSAFTDVDSTTGKTHRYVIYKAQANGMHPGPFATMPIMLHEVANDGVTKVGKPVGLLNHHGAKDDGINEAPAMVKVGGKCLLFYSGGRFDTDHYYVGYAVGEDVRGPFRKMPKLGALL